MIGSGGRNDLAARAYEIALALTAWPSVTGSAADATMAERLLATTAHFDAAWTENIPGDPRRNVLALKRGRTRRTIVLTGHFDVVPVEDYGEQKLLAFEPEALLPSMIARLKSSGENPGALVDFESGDFLPGRGLLDMKAGLEIGRASCRERVSVLV